MGRWTGTWIAAGFLAALAPAALAGQAAPAADEKPKEPATKVAANKDGFVIQSGDGAFRLRFSGYAQADGRFYLGDEDGLGTNALILRRVRPVVTGTVGKIFEFSVMPDFGGGVTVIQDAYVDVLYSDRARLRVGKYKVPLGLEVLQSDTGILFVERAFPASLSPVRDVGVQLHGELGSGVASYAVGIFNGALDGASADNDANDGKDVAGRVFFQPFRKGKSRTTQGIGIGIAATTGKQEGALPSYRSPGQLTFFTYANGITARGRRTRVFPQASYAVGPFRLVGEYVRSSQEVTKGTETSEVTNDAWQGVAAFLLTGETPTGGVVSPKRPFGTDKGWGAFELAARYSQIHLDDAIFALGLADTVRSTGEATAFALGINWYLTRNVKYVVHYERTQFEGGRTRGDRETENALLFRVQLTY